MKEVKILHQVSGRNRHSHSREFVMRGLTEGKYYLAGTIQVIGDVDYDNGEGNADWSEVLENAWHDSQNDTHPNHLQDKDGEDLEFTFQDLVEELGLYEAADAYARGKGYNVLPAVWNINDEAGPDEKDHAFAQRSSMVGDLLVVEGRIYRAECAGFKAIVGYNLLDRKRGIVLADNPWAPGGDIDSIEGRIDRDESWVPQGEINTEFDELLTD